MTHELRAITLVLASQRSGSTLLCRDIESLGGMGAPREYFLDIVGRNTREGLTEADVLDQIARGVKPDAPGIGAVKLMVSYAPKIDSYIRGAEAVAPQKAVQNIIDWAQERFDRVNLVALVRGNSLEQAISRAVANMTDVWHRHEATTKDGDLYADVKLPTKALNLAILEALPGVIRQTQVVRRIAKANPDLCWLIKYEHLAASVEDSSAQLITHARKAGFEPTETMASRSLRKLIDKDKTEDFKANFKAFMKRHL
ncbi:Stf0 family sulfotransferase [Sedimentitalea todarodis]|uniref:Stf0 family sulfotransferase n=1 Tax=Sedimentitalea todarodis TaxID=1631240 RepID=A0ABU3VK36_9RHOB|nr:Stf0 family sulfotransferase [Sedimentitalea todarodis]MDU9006519.1 Stf0 family sulfotransferase [Sedimentitalea todarodis]